MTVLETRRYPNFKKLSRSSLVYTPPKSIVDHPAVESCEDAKTSGNDYKHDVWLKEGWVFENGRMAGCRSLFCHNVKDFLFANPIKILERT